MMSKRILLSGYYGFGNAGDEAVLAGTLVGLRELAPGCEVVVLSADSAVTGAEHGVRAVPRWKWRRVWQELRSADALISGGGSLLQDVTSAQSPIYYLLIMLMAMKLGIPVAVFAQGIGPLRRRWVRELVRRVLNRVKIITVRDEESAFELKRLGVIRPPIHVGADAAFLLRQGVDTDAMTLLEELGISHTHGPFIGAALRLPPGKEPWAKLSKNVGEGLLAAADALGGRALLLCMHPADEHALDLVLPAGSQVAVVAPYRSGVAYSQRLVGLTEVLVGMRLHSLIFAALRGIPMVGLVYDPKVEAFLKQIGSGPALFLEGLKAEALAGRIVEAYETRQEIKARMAERVSALRESALEGLRLVSQALGVWAERDRRKID